MRKQKKLFVCLSSFLLFLSFHASILLFVGLTALLVKFVVFVLYIPACVPGFYWHNAAVVAGGAPVRVVWCVTQLLTLLTIFFGLDLCVHFGCQVRSGLDNPSAFLHPGCLLDR